MKTLKTGLISLLISFVFAGSLGLPVFNHFCNTSGHSSTSVLIQNDHCDEEKEVKTCCAEEKETEKDCCSDETVIYQVKFNFFNPYKEAPLPFIIPSIHNDFFFDSIHTVVADQKENLAFEEPDPPSGREILLQTSILRI